MKKLQVEVVTAYMVTASTDDRAGSKVVGYYADPNIANMAAKKAGWWGSDGDVIPKTMLMDAAGNLYNGDTVGPFKDLDESATKVMLENIKSKLTPEEWAFYESQTKSK